MHRIDTPGATPDNRFTEGDPTIPTAATEVSAEWLNAVQEEVAAVIAGAGIALDKADNGQLLEAITALITASIPGAPPVATTEAAGLVERATNAEALAGTDTTRYVTPAHLLPFLRSMWAGCIVEWECETVPTLADGAPLGLELNGNVVSLTTFPRLSRKWCGEAKNATAPAWYRCTAAGVRDAAGEYIRLQDRRGEFARGWDHGRGVDAGRVLGSAQGDELRAHDHVVRYSANAVYNAVGGANAVSAPYVNLPFKTEAAGGAETRPRNIAAMYIVLI